MGISIIIEVSTGKGERTMRLESIEMLLNTLGIFERGFYEIGDKRIPVQLSKEEQTKIQVFLPEELEKIRASEDKMPQFHEAQKIEFKCFNKDSFTVAREMKEKKVLVLNLANPVHPGGGVRRGAKAQEEDLCRKSSLLCSLESEEAGKYYAYNKAKHSYMATDALMITPQVEVIRDEQGRLLPESAIVSVLTCAAPMLSHGGREDLPADEAEYVDLLYHRIEGILLAAAYAGYENIVLGAFGCGAFGNDARLVSDLFYKAITEMEMGGGTAENYFKKIHFAVLCRHHAMYNFNEFNRNFGEKPSSDRKLTTLCYIEKDGKYLMLHRTKKKKDINKNKWIGVGGHAEGTEGPEDCLLREVKEETGLTLTNYRFRGLITFVCDQMEPELMCLFTADEFEGELKECTEGDLAWMDKETVLDLPTWEGDAIFLKLLVEGEKRFFSLRLVYEGENLVEHQLYFY